VSKIIEKDLIGRGMDEINAKSQADAFASGYIYQEPGNAFERAGVPENVEIRYEYGSDGKKIVGVDGFYRKLELIPGENYEGRILKVVQNVSLGDKEVWNSMKHLQALGIEENGNINADVKKNIEVLKNLLRADGMSGEDIKPRGGETVAGWLRRVVESSTEKQDFFQQAA
jgi:hypothetical protein